MLKGIMFLKTLDILDFLVVSAWKFCKKAIDYIMNFIT